VFERSDPANAKFVLFLLIPLMASAHERVFAAAVKQPLRPVISWLCKQTAKETHVLLTIWRSQCVCYTSTRHLLCHNMFYDHTLGEIWMLPDICVIRD
jgi:hypothetical protein